MIFNYGKQGCDKLIYDGVCLSDIFEIVDVKLPLTPQIAAATLEAAQRPGSYFSSLNIGNRTIVIKLRLNAESRCPVDIYMEWAKVSNTICKTEPRPLYIGADRYINVLLSGQVNIEQKATYGEAEITFTAYDPFFYGATHEIEIAGTTTFNVLGDFEVYPEIEITTSSTTAKITNTNTGDFISIPGIKSGSKYVVSTERQSVLTSAGVFQPVELASDFFALKTGAASIKLTGCSGILKYTERYL